MNKSLSLLVRPSIPCLSFKRVCRNEVGMTILELIVAVLMLVVFTGVVAMVMEFTFRFMRDSEAEECKTKQSQLCQANEEIRTSNGVLIDHKEIQHSMDLLVDMLSSPGISKERLDGKVIGKPRIAFDPVMDDPSVACVASDPVQQWDLPMQKISIPSGYRLCLWKTSAVEPPLTNLLSGSGAKPGIYLLQALPERLNASTLPTRRLFCRPRPFC